MSSRAQSPSPSKVSSPAPAKPARPADSPKKKPLNAVTDTDVLGSAFRNGAVTFRMGRLEPFIALALAGATAWINLFHTQAAYTVWVVALYAAAIGFWGRMFPARRELTLLARGALLMCGAFVLHTAAGTQGPSGLYLFWPLAIIVSYALLLPTGWAVLLAVFGLVEIALCSWLVLAPGEWVATIAQVGLLGAFAPIALMFGRSMHLSDRQVELSLMDRRTRLYNEAGFLEYGAVLLEDCRRAKRPFSLVLLNAADLRDVPGLLGRKTGQKLFNQAVRGIASAIQGEGLAARTDSAVFALILPGLTAAKAQALVCQKLGDPPSVQLDLPHGKVTVVLDMVVAEADAGTLALEDLYDTLQGRLREPRGAAPAGNKLADKLARTKERAPVDGALPRAASPTVPMPLAQPAA